MTTDERRRAILECAARLFRHYGHGKTTVADIAREAQMGVGTFYLVFPSKEAIVEELSARSRRSTSSVRSRSYSARTRRSRHRGCSSSRPTTRGARRTRCAACCCSA